MERAVIIEGARTPIGRFLGSFADTTTVELGTMAAVEAMRRADIEPGAVDQTIVGHARQAGNGPNTGRQVSVKAGVPIEVGAFNVNIACGSGMKAVQLAAQQIMLGDSEVVLAGGMENMTRVPFMLDRMRTGYRMGDATVYDGMYRDGLLDPLCGLIMGETAENLVEMYDISREEQDAFALESQQKAAVGRAARAPEIFPVEVESGKGTIAVTDDEHVRPDATMGTLAKLSPVFKEGGSVTAVHDVSDGGMLVALAEMALASRVGIQLDRALVETAFHLFGEAQGRYIIATRDDGTDYADRWLNSLLHIGECIGNSLAGTTFKVGLNDLLAANERFFREWMEA